MFSGYYARSPDYMAIVQAERVGVWNVPFIYGAYLIKGDLITHKDEEKRPNFIHKLLDADMSFCANLREADVFFYVTNRANFGHLGTIHILRKHFYSTKLNLNSKFFTKTVFFCQNKRISLPTLHFDKFFTM